MSLRAKIERMMDEAARLSPTAVSGIVHGGAEVVDDPFRVVQQALQAHQDLRVIYRDALLMLADAVDAAE